MVVFEDYLVRLERNNALPRIVVRSLANGAEHGIGFDEDAFDLSLMPGYEFDHHDVAFFLQFTDNAAAGLRL